MFEVPAKAQSKYNPQPILLLLFFCNVNWSCRTFLMENKSGFFRNYFSNFFVFVCY